MTRSDRFGGRCLISGHAISAVLVESRRVNGSPRQRFVAHLGTVGVWENGRGQVAIGTGRALHSEVMGFWGRVSRSLDGVAEPFDRDVVEAMIGATVPRPCDVCTAPSTAHRVPPACALRNAV